MDEERGSHLVRPTAATLGAEEGDEKRERGVVIFPVSVAGKELLLCASFACVCVRVSLGACKLASCWHDDIGSVIRTRTFSH